VTVRLKLYMVAIRHANHGFVADRLAIRLDVAVGLDYRPVPQVYRHGFRVYTLVEQDQ
jgi:hypothetical protein